MIVFKNNMISLKMSMVPFLNILKAT